MKHCRDAQNRPICLDCANRGVKRGELTNAVNASEHAIKCSACGKEIPGISQQIRSRRA